jgi:3-dehydroquinate dehydratase II
VKKILILNGPNLNMLGQREKGIYGSVSYDQMCRQIEDYSEDLGVGVKIFQSNHEGEAIDMIHKAGDDFDGLIINPGAWAHYSYAVRDAIACIQIPVIEVHLSNVYARESFRHQSVTAPVTNGQISGLGVHSYFLAVQYFKNCSEVLS